MDERRKDMLRKARGGLPLTAEQRAEADIERILKHRRVPISKVSKSASAPRGRVIKKQKPTYQFEERKQRWREEKLRLDALEIQAAVEVTKVLAKLESDRKPPVIHIHQAEQRVIIDGQEAEPVG